MSKFFLDNLGRVIGNVREYGGRKVYSDERGRVVGYVTKDSSGKETTMTVTGTLVGTHDQGLKLLTK